MKEMGLETPNKVRFTVWLLEDLFNAIETWLSEHQGETRTNFVTRALISKIQSEGLKLPRSAVCAALQEGAVPGKLRRQNRRLGVLPAPRRGNKVLVTTWLDRRILAAMDISVRKSGSKYNRTDFFIEATAEALRNEGLITKEQYFTLGIRRPLKPGVQKSIRQLAREVRSLLKETEIPSPAKPYTQQTRQELETLLARLRGGLGKIAAELKKFEDFEATANQWGTTS